MPLDMIGSPRMTGYSRAASDCRTAVTNGIILSQDQAAYPTSLATLRHARYANVPGRDPWGREYVLAPVLVRGGPPQAGDDVYVCSTGPCGTGPYPFPPRAGGAAAASNTAKCGAVGYSSLYGGFSGQ
jgi:hypothetical protein